jgi:AbrB family looped-hinge helix DNA binding protein
MKTTINRDGRLTIPKSMRKAIGIELEEEIEMTVVGNKIIISNKEVSTLEEYKYRVNKALGELENPFENEDDFNSWYQVAETYKEQIENAKKTLLGE